MSEAATDRFHRSVLVVTPEMRTRMAALSVMVIGCGAVGGRIAKALGLMGEWKSMVLVDPQEIDESNVHTQGWDMDDVGGNKVDVLARSLRRFGFNNPIDTVKGVWNSTIGSAEVVCVCPDTIEARRNIFETIYKLSPRPQCYVDGRIGGTIGYVVTNTPENGGVNYYRSTLFPANEAEQSGCTQASFSATADAVVSFMENQITQFLAGSRIVPPHRHLKIDLGDSYVGPVLMVPPEHKRAGMYTLRELPQAIKDRVNMSTTSLANLTGEQFGDRLEEAYSAIA